MRSDRFRDHKRLVQPFFSPRTLKFIEIGAANSTHAPLISSANSNAWEQAFEG
jgi:hypothetical protein